MCDELMGAQGIPTVIVRYPRLFEYSDNIPMCEGCGIFTLVVTYPRHRVVDTF